MPIASKPAQKPLDKLIGEWTTEATHPALPDVVVYGTVAVEWLEGERFLIHRARTDHPQFPDSISIIGSMEQDRVDDTGKQPAALQPRLTMHYYDSRGVYRAYESSIDAASWRWQRLSTGFSQRFTGTFANGGNTIEGLSQLCRDDVHWADDLRIRYQRK